MKKYIITTLIFTTILLSIVLYKSDTKSINYTLLGSHYLSYKTYIYHINVDKYSQKQLRIVENADTETFKVDDESIFVDYATDKNAIYISGKRYDIDPLSFRSLSAGYYHDGKNYYKIAAPRNTNGYSSKNIYDSLIKIEESEIYTEKPRVFSPNDMTGFIGYIIDGNEIFYGPAGLTRKNTKKVEGGDPETLVIIRNNSSGYSKSGWEARYAKDKNYVYYEGNIIEGADSNTFKPTEFKNTNSFWPYTKDKKHVYYEDGIILDADPNTFKTLSNGDGYSKDSSHVYFKNKEILSVDNATFSIISKENKSWYEYYIYAKDRNKVYYMGNVIQGADLPTFQIIEGRYSKDKNGIYVSGVFDKNLPLNFIPPYEGEG